MLRCPAGYMGGLARKKHLKILDNFEGSSSLAVSKKLLAWPIPQLVARILFWWLLFSPSETTFHDEVCHGLAPQGPGL